MAAIVTLSIDVPAEDELKAELDEGLAELKRLAQRQLCNIRLEVKDA